jgi:hypothetical protein
LRRGKQSVLNIFDVSQILSDVDRRMREKTNVVRLCAMCYLLLALLSNHKSVLHSIVKLF